ncbi:MAG: hypothetical protein WCO68_03355 [Verrucomicrobiota bacterium]
MNTIRAKVLCVDVDAKPGYENVTFQAVYDDGGNENKSFSEATPSLGLSMTISNPAALGSFKAGNSYYLDFSEAKEQEESKAEPEQAPTPEIPEPDVTEGSAEQETPATPVDQDSEASDPTDAPTPAEAETPSEPASDAAPAGV